MIAVQTIDNSNLDTLNSAIDAAADAATRAALEIIQPAILEQTPERSGDLKRSESTFQRGEYVGVFRADMFYASYVNDGTKRTLPTGREVVIPPNPFIDRGVEQSEVEAMITYELTFDRIMEGLGRG